MNKKVIVVSAINIFEGGTLNILLQVLTFANLNLNQYKIITLINSKSLFPESEFTNIEFIAFPKSRKSYIFRIYYEYIYFKKLSKRIQPFLWLSLHDISPNVVSEKKAVYCHNPTPFKKIKISDLYFQPAVFFFNLFYKYLYKINIKKNNFVIVQQKWLKSEFKKMFNLKDEKILVCYPSISNVNKINGNDNSNENQINKKITFFFPALARPFKNFEIICEATSELIKKGFNNFEVILTINGQENRYSKFIFNKFKNIENIKFIGKITFDEVNEYYKKSDVLIFPSTLETWGLPISEFKIYEKPILLSDLPYAKETLGNYNKAMFFDPENHKELSLKMLSLINNKPIFDITQTCDEVILQGWQQLFERIL